MRRPLRVGLLGGGGIATSHLRVYAEHADRAVVTAVADALPEIAQQRAAELGAVAYADALELIAHADVDAVDVCLPHHLHAQALVAAARAGLHILCEKPLCLTLDEARTIADAVSQAGVTLMCAHNQLFLPPVAHARALLAAGRLGRVYEVRTTDCFVNAFSPESMGWRSSAATSGGGEHIDTGYHPSYLLLDLAGGGPVEVVAMLATHRLAFMEGEDSAQLLVRFDNGVLGHVATSWAYQPPSTTKRFSVVGELGALFGTAETLTTELHDGTRETVVFDPVDTYAAEIGHFADCLLEGGRPPHAVPEGARVLALILAAYASARSGAVAPVAATP